MLVVVTGFAVVISVLVALEETVLVNDESTELLTVVTLVIVGSI